MTKSVNFCSFYGFVYVKPIHMLLFALNLYICYYLNMANVKKYNFEYVAEVERLINQEKMTRRNAILKAGFSSHTLFYDFLKKNNMKEQVSYVVENVSFL